MKTIFPSSPVEFQPLSCFTESVVVVVVVIAVSVVGVVGVVGVVVVGGGVVVVVCVCVSLLIRKKSRKFLQSPHSPSTPQYQRLILYSYPLCFLASKHHELC